MGILMNRFENKIYNAIEAEERFFDEMRPKSIGAYNQRMVEHMVNIADLEERIAVEKALLKFSRRQFKSAVNGMAYDQGLEPVYYEED
jgi:hypothetical protein